MSNLRRKSQSMNYTSPSYIHSATQRNFGSKSTEPWCYQSAGGGVRRGKLIREKFIRPQHSAMSQKGASKEQIRIPQGARIPISEKALDLLGSNELREMSRKQIPNQSELKNRKKLVQKFGAPELAGPKATSILGGSEERPSCVKTLADKQLKREQEELRQAYLKKVLKARPTSQQLSLRLKENNTVPQKALELMGEESLSRAVREYVPENVVISPKALAVLGDSKLIRQKALSILGDISDDVRIRKEANESMKNRLGEAFKQNLEVLKSPFDTIERSQFNDRWQQRNEKPV